MNTIFKYKLQPGLTELDIPSGAQVLTVQMQHGAACLWALVDASQPTERRTFNAYGAGHVLPSDPGVYVATFQMDSGTLVWHVFENATGEMAK